MSAVDLRFGDCLAVLRTMGDASVDAVVTDPPYGLAAHRPAVVTAAVVAWAQGDRERVPDGRGFMGRAWDGFVPPPAVFDECLRVLKPGGHLLCFAGTRTVDLMGLSVRLAGFELRDSITWLYGSGFPKSLDVGKAIDKAAGATREVVDRRKGAQAQTTGRFGGWGNDDGTGRSEFSITTPATDAARQWQGWGTALKPASEPIIVARKPLAGTVAANVQAHGTGALNIDGCRVPTTDTWSATRRTALGVMNDDGWQPKVTQAETHDAGRWPSNVVLDEHAAAALDAQTGGVSRFFYCAKAPKSERPVVDGQAHPTVKPLTLMRLLVRLVTPPGGTVLDPFAGSGTTLQAARDAGFDAVGIESWDLAYRLSCQRLGLPDELPAPVLAEPVPAIDEPATAAPAVVAVAAPLALVDVVEHALDGPADPVLAAIAVARSDDELTATWRRHAAAWSEVHTVAVRARLAELGDRAA